MMKLLTFVIFTAVLALATATGKEDGPPPEPTSNTTIAPDPITSPKPTKPTTSVTTSTTSATTPTTRTTTPTTPITTKATVTTAAPPNTTTSAPLTTTVPPLPPAPVNPEIGTYTVNYTNSNASCIVAKMAICLEIPYVTKANKTVTAHLNVPVNATVTGSCGEYNQTLSLAWGKNNFDYIEFTFVKANKTYDLNGIEASISPDTWNFPNINNSAVLFHLVNSAEHFNTTLKKSYKCEKVQTFNFTNTFVKVDNKSYFLHVSHLQLQAFSNTTTTGFEDAEDCEPRTTPDIVPIAAGCALAVLIIIVVVGYLIGRRRSQARGYLSM